VALKPIHNEAEIIEEVAKGNEKAFADLFYAYHNQLGEFVMLLTHSHEQTEEIIQDVFVKVWMNREKLLSIDKFTSYLFILARNYTLNSIRNLVNDRKSKELYSNLELSNIENEFAIIDKEHDPDYEALIDKAIANLPPQQQKVFILRRNGLKNIEIAQKMDISPQSVKKYQQWALKSVAEFVKTHAALSAILLIISSSK
jgi:RNA polymerase sigma factor (sigma-70 family)